MTQQPKVSIIVNNYNYGRFLGQAIESALAQTYPNVEVIVVDDGSTDNSREVIARYGGRVIPVLKANGGQGSAFNAGFKISTGDLIVFLDSDDVLEPNAAGTIVREWRDGVVRMLFRLTVIDGHGEPMGRVAGGSKLPSPAVGPFGTGSSTSGNAFSREVLERILPLREETWTISADWYLTTADLFGEVECLRQVLGKYRLHRDKDHPRIQPLSVSRDRVHWDLVRYEEVFRLTGGKVAPLKDWLGTCPEHWVRRIISLRESPHDHPWPDTLPGLTLEALKAVWRKPDRNFRRRLAYSIFVLGYSVLPRGVTHAMLQIEGREHGRTFRGLLGARKRVREETEALAGKPLS